MLNVGDKVILRGMFNSKLGVTTSTVKSIGKNTAKLENGYTVYHSHYRGVHSFFGDRYNQDRLHCDIRPLEDGRAFAFYPQDCIAFTQEDYGRVVSGIMEEVQIEQEYDRKNLEREIAMQPFKELERQLLEESNIKKQDLWLKTMCETCRFNKGDGCSKIHGPRELVSLEEAWRWSSCSWEKGVTK